MVTSNNFSGIWISTDLTHLQRDMQRILRIQFKEFVYFLDEAREETNINRAWVRHQATTADYLMRAA